MGYPYSNYLNHSILIATFYITLYIILFCHVPNAAMKRERDKIKDMSKGNALAQNC